MMAWPHHEGHHTLARGAGHLDGHGQWAGQWAHQRQVQPLHQHDDQDDEHLIGMILDAHALLVLVVVRHREGGDKGRPLTTRHVYSLFAKEAVLTEMYTRGGLYDSDIGGEGRLIQSASSEGRRLKM